MAKRTFNINWKKILSSISRYHKVKKSVWQIRKNNLRIKMIRVLSSQDAHSIFKSLFAIVMDGLFISGLLYYFIGFRWGLVLPFGAGWFWVRNDALVQLRKTIGSLNLVKTGK